MFKVMNFVGTSPTPEPLEEGKIRHQMITDESEIIDNINDFIELIRNEFNDEVKIFIVQHENEASKYQNHLHIFIDSEEKINPQTLYKLYRTQTGGKKQMEVIILDESRKDGYRLEQQQKTSLSKKGENDFSYLKKDGGGVVEVLKGYTKDGAKNPTGLGKTDRPNYVLKGITNDKSKLITEYNLEYTFEEIPPNGLYTDMETALRENLIKEIEKLSHSKAIDPNFTSLNFEERGNKIVVKFNNLFVSQNGEVISIAKNLLEPTIEKITAPIFSNHNILLQDARFKRENTLNQLQAREEEQHQTQQINQSLKQVSKETQNISIEELGDGIELNTFEKMALESILLKRETKAREEALTKTILEKEQSIQEQAGRIEKQKEELETINVELKKTNDDFTEHKAKAETTINGLNADNQKLSAENKEQSKRIDVISKDLDTTKKELDTTTQSLNKANEDNKKLGDENKEQSKRIDVISKDLDTTKKELEQSRTTAAQTTEQLKEATRKNEVGAKYAEQQNKQIAVLTTEKTDLQIENERLRKDIAILLEENQTLLNQKSGNNGKGNGNGRAPK